ncbi:hypothetical protein [Ruegeria sp. HKCCE4150]|uniref:hypothetical protein n=1 Tax=Ruegeria sp. HKCCE4150 TaxID=2794828 RepID=UPI001AE93BE8|nr:hypothetical protein [Ruegeria sp. HKCCE4150]
MKDLLQGKSNDAKVSTPTEYTTKAQDDRPADFGMMLRTPTDYKVPATYTDRTER